MKLFILKNFLKELASKIQEARKNLKEHQRGHGGSDGGHYYNVDKLSIEYRHKHIAYCLLRGTPMEKIETLPKHPEKKTYTAPDKTLIEAVMNEYRDIPQDVCTSA